MGKSIISFLCVAVLLSGCADNTVREAVSGDKGEYGKSTFSSYKGLEDSVAESIENSITENAESLANSLTESSASSLTESPFTESFSNSSADKSENSLVESLESLSTENSIPQIEVFDNTVSSDYQLLNYSEVKGIWISYLEISGMESGSESAFRESIGSVYDNCVTLGINTVYVHVRSHGDAYYNSELFPKTKYIDGNFDALKIMVDEAHKRDLSFQAWINPFRMCAESEIERESGYPIYEWAGGDTKLVLVGGYYWLNPAYDDVIDLIAKGAAEIVSNYDVDGLHIDDYFYPTTEDWFDLEAFKSSDYNSLSDFRFANCDRMVSAIYKAVKTAKPNAVFGISCQGSLQNNYELMYADVRKWCSNYGYTDYIMPQIYYGFENSAQPFNKCASEWDAIAQKGKKPLIIGLSVSKIGYEDQWAGEGRYEWLENSDILKRQFDMAYDLPSYGGICLYSYKSVFSPDEGVSQQVSAEVTALESVMNR